MGNRRNRNTNIVTLILIKFTMHCYRKSFDTNKFNDIIFFKVQKGNKEKLKAYAMLKGFKTENEYLSYLVNEQMKKDSEKLSIPTNDQ